jgi:hypothetical protein
VAIDVGADPQDSTVTVHREAAVGDSVGLGDTTFVLPLPVATFIREAKPQLHRLTLALHEVDALLVVKDARIGTLERADSLWRVRDSLHVQRERQLEAARGKAFKSGIVAGVKGTVKVLLVVVTVVTVAQAVPK